MAEKEEIGVELVVKGFEAFLLKMELVNKSIQGTAAASVVSKIALIGLSLAFGAVALAVGAVIAGIGLVAIGFLALGVASISVGRSIESAFAGVAKTTNGLTDEFGRVNEAGKALKEEFLELSKVVPLPIEELLKIGEFGGQLGVAKENLVAFTEVVAQLGITTQLSTEEAAIGLARIAEVYDISTEDMIENTERLGSAIVFLGNNFATSEPEILSFSKRLAGIASFAGIGQAALLGFGAALTSVGVESQLGATAIQNTIIAMAEAVEEGGEKLEAFAEISGKTSDEFVEDWGENAEGAVVDFIEGIGQMGQEAFAALKEVGLASDRTERALLPLAAAGDLLRRSIDGSTQAWEDNTARAREAAIFYETLDSKMQLLENTIRIVGNQIFEVMEPALKALIDKITPLVEAIGNGLVPAFASIFDALKDNLLPALGNLIEAFGFNITGSNLTEGIANFGEAIAGGIESFSDFVDDVAHLVDLYNEGGIDSVAEHFGINKESVDLFFQIGEAVLVAAVSFVALRNALIVGAFIAGVIGTIATAMGNLGAAIALIASGEGVLATIGALLVGITVAPILLVAAIAGLIGVIVAFGEDALTSLQQLVIIAVVLIGQLLGNIATLFSNMWSSIQANTGKALADFIISVIEWKNKTIETIVEWGVQAVLAVIDTWFQIVENTKKSWDDFIQGIIDWRDETIENIVELGVDAVLAVVDWWFNMIDTLKTEGAKWGVALDTWIEDMVTKLDASVSDWLKVGKAMMDGLLQGLKNNIGPILAFITKLALTVLDTILSVFGVSSPSKEFENIGTSLMEGLALGISKNAFLPQVALDFAANSMIAAESQIASGGTTSGNVDNSTSFNVNANYADTQSPSSIADDLALAAMLAGA